MAIEKWLNSHISLFDVTNSQTEYLDNIEISILEFTEDIVSDYTICNIILTGELPLEYLLRVNKERKDFDIVLLSYGPRDEYDKDRVIMKLRECVLIDKGMDDIIAIRPGDVASIDIWAEFRGLVKVIL